VTISGSIEIEAVKALYEKRLAALKSRFADKYAEFISFHKKD
jgi:hypothetical protein